MAWAIVARGGGDEFEVCVAGRYRVPLWLNLLRYPECVCLLYRQLGAADAVLRGIQLRRSDGKSEVVVAAGVEEEQLIAVRAQPVVKVQQADGHAALRGFPRPFPAGANAERFQYVRRLPFDFFVGLPIDEDAQRPGSASSES
ncbi:hypothetical protein ACFSUI_04090 [Ralstonia solanacearum]